MARTFKYTITDPAGIHARPAGLLVKEAQGFDSNVTLKVGDKSVDAKRILMLMTSGIAKGDEVEVSVEGGDEAEAASKLERFFKENL